MQQPPGTPQQGDDDDDNEEQRNLRPDLNFNSRIIGLAIDSQGLTNARNGIIRKIIHEEIEPNLMQKIHIINTEFMKPNNEEEKRLFLVILYWDLIFWDKHWKTRSIEETNPILVTRIEEHNISVNEVIASIDNFIQSEHSSPQILQSLQQDRARALATRIDSVNFFDNYLKPLLQRSFPYLRQVYHLNEPLLQTIMTETKTIMTEIQIPPPNQAGGLSKRKLRKTKTKLRKVQKQKRTKKKRKKTKGGMERRDMKNREWDERAHLSQLLRGPVRPPTDKEYDAEVAYFYEKLMKEKKINPHITEEYIDKEISDLLDSQYNEKPLSSDEKKDIMVILENWYKSKVKNPRK